MGNTVVLWVGFHLLVGVMLVIDLGLARRRDRPPTARGAAAWTLVWVALSGGIGAAVSWRFGPTRGEEFFTGYVVEYVLSVDNLFVFLMLFSFFKVKPQYQHRLLFWGVVGQFAMRAPLLVLGTQVVRSFHAVLYFFGAFLIYTAVKTAFSRGEAESDPERGWMLKVSRRLIPLSHGEVKGFRLMVREDGRLKFTPLFLVLVVVNLTDLVFALDSIPAVLGVTQDPFVAYSSNVCAIFGLRSLFSVVASLMSRLRYLKAAVAVILGFVGAKMIASYWVDVPVLWSLGVIAACLTIALVASYLFPQPRGEVR